MGQLTFANDVMAAAGAMTLAQYRALSQDKQVAIADAQIAVENAMADVRMALESLAHRAERLRVLIGKN